MIPQDFAGFNAIGLALDGSRLSESAIPVVKEMARQFDSMISVITVLDWDVTTRFAGFANEEGESLEGAVRAYQNRWIDDLREDGLLAAGHVVELRDTSTADTIRSVAENVDVSLLVIGAHSTEGTKRFTTGTTAEGLISDGHIPVLVVRPTRAESFAEL